MQLIIFQPIMGTLANDTHAGWAVDTLAKQIHCLTKIKHVGEGLPSVGI